MNINRLLEDVARFGPAAAPFGSRRRPPDVLSMFANDKERLVAMKLPQQRGRTEVAVGDAHLPRLQLVDDRFQQAPLLGVAVFARHEIDDHLPHRIEHA